MQGAPAISGTPAAPAEKLPTKPKEEIKKMPNGETKEPKQVSIIEPLETPKAALTVETEIK